MVFFSQPTRTIEKDVRMSDEEFKIFILRNMENSNAFQRHKLVHKDAHITTIADSGGFSKMEKSLGKDNDSEPVITYNASTHVAKGGCSCEKIEFDFNLATDEVNAVSTTARMREFEPYRKKGDNTSDTSYGKSGNTGYNSSSANMTYNGPRQRNTYSSSAQYDKNLEF